MEKIILFLIIQMQIFAYMNISPVNFDKRIDGIGNFQEYKINNITNKTLKYRIYKEAGEGNDMSSWMEIYPENLTLNPGQEKKIKVYINSPSNIPKGEYNAILGIKEIGIPTKENPKGTLEVFTNLKLKIYGYIGELNPKLDLNNIKVQKGKNKEEFQMFGKIYNKSNRRIDIEVLLGNSEQKYLIGEKRLRKGEELDLKNLKSLNMNNKDLEKNYKKLNTIYIYEKGNTKVLNYFNIK